MTVSVPSTRTVSYAGDGGSGPFPVPFRVLEANDLKAAVVADGGTRTVLEAFAVTGAGELSGAAVTTAEPIGVGETLVLWTETALVQPADYLAGDAFPAETHEGALDRLTLIAQDARRDIERAFKAPVGSPEPDDKTYEELVADAAAEVGSDAVALVNVAGAGQVGVVNAAGTVQVELIDLAGDFQVGRVEDEGDDQIALAVAASEAQVALVENKGDEQLARIASAMGGDLYEDTAAGIAALSVGDYFSTPGTKGAALNVYRVDVGPAATLITSLEGWQTKALRFFFGRARHDTAISGGLRPWVEPYRLRMYMGTLAGGAVKNANGTYTLPANATWTSTQLSAGVFDVTGDRFAYVPTTVETTGAIQIKISRGGSIIAAGNTTAQPTPDFYRQAWNNSGALPYVQIEIKNVSASDVTIYPIELYPADQSYFPQVLRFDAGEVVTEDRTIIDWNAIAPYARWKRLALDRDLRALDESRITHAFDSAGGLDTAAGLPWSAKQNLTAGSALGSGSVLGLKRGSTWNQSVNTMIGSTTQGLGVCDYSAGRVFDPLPILDSAVDVTGLIWTSEGSDTFSATVPCATDTIKTGEQNYSFISVVEITLADQATKPRGCRRLLIPQRAILAGSVPAADQSTAINNVKAQVGSTLGVFSTGNTSYKLYVHTRDGLAPSASITYGYRATNIGSCMDWIQGSTRQAVVSGIDFRQGADGLGIVCGSNQSYFSRVIAMDGYKHTLHIEGGTVCDAILSNKGAGANANGDNANAGNCYVSPTADGYAWRWTNGMAFECSSAIYSHAAAGKYAQGEISYWWFIHDRDSPTGSLVIGDPCATDQCDKAEEAWCYYQGYISNGRSGTYVNPCITHHHHNLVRKTGRFVSRTLTENNIVQVENIGGAGAGDRHSRGCQLKENHVVRKNLIHITTVVTGVADYSGSALEVVPSGNNNPDFSRNIVILDNTLGTSSTWVAEASAGLTWTSDFNLIILCVPGSFASTKHGGTTKTTIADYLAFFPGHDANSLFIDLRDDPRGSRAIFVDPANGDYRWAQTPEAARAKAYCEVNGVGPEWITKAFPTIPTVDEACAALAAA